ncbi:VOC family protein [Streptomyces oceani]|uniref:3-demethylubiquinone-9 3-methyltransferase n=1 Tax=Streptomyces oceani TaxID=1075402 RepID=A0A1E7JX97_9ACTN|nr:VOC family protein [Streptomyces oceani]OEU96281.1 3-demethylubiquinone-9 3-methyltransferase [Streptomyces oceani]
MQKIVTFLWFDEQAEEAARYYTAIFEDSRIVDIQRYGDAGPRTDGSVMTVTFELAGQRFVALNGGPEFRFSEAISLFVDCGPQSEVDYFWERLGAGGAEGDCGWLTDKYGLSWQIVPRRLMELQSDPDPETSQRAMRAMLGMKKIDIQGLEDAVRGRA